MKGYDANLGKRRYVICRVGDVFPDQAGLVRTVEIWFRPRDSREPSLPYNNKNLVSEKISAETSAFNTRNRALNLFAP